MYIYSLIVSAIIFFCLSACSTSSSDKKSLDLNNQSQLTTNKIIFSAQSDDLLKIENPYAAISTGDLVSIKPKLFSQNAAGYKEKTKWMSRVWALAGSGQDPQKPFDVELRGPAAAAKQALELEAPTSVTIETTIQSINSVSQKSEAKPDSLYIALRTLEKQGDLDLYSLAFPELGEVLNMQLSRQGQVLQVEGQKPGSIFYIPAIDLPLEPVQVGSTWHQSHQWWSYESHLPFRISTQSKLLRFVQCEGNKSTSLSSECVEIEITGEIEIDENALEPVQRLGLLGVQFRHQLKGLYLFHISQGSVLWSRVQSHEVLSTPDARRDVMSCLEGLRIEPALPGAIATQILEPTCSL